MLSAEKASQQKKKKKSILYDFSIKEIYDNFSNEKKKANKLVEISHDSS